MDSSPISPPPGISGRKVTAGVMLILMGLVLAIAYVLWSYDSYERTRKESSEAWRKVAVRLDQDYSAVALKLSGSAELDQTKSKDFFAILDSFRTSPNAHHQAAAANKIEQLADSLTIVVRLPAATDDLKSLVSDYNRSVEQQQKQLETAAGKLLSRLIQLPAGLQLESRRLAN